MHKTKAKQLQQPFPPPVVCAELLVFFFLYTVVLLALCSSPSLFRSVHFGFVQRLSTLSDSVCLNNLSHNVFHCINSFKEKQTRTRRCASRKCKTAGLVTLISGTKNKISLSIEQDKAHRYSFKPNTTVHKDDMLLLTCFNTFPATISLEGFHSKLVSYAFAS